jgi:NADH dehydrogenase
MSGSTGYKKIVIIGGGFGGLYAARALRSAPAAVTLIDRTAQHVFQPLLYQCATGILSEGQITAPLRKLFQRHRNLRCLTADAVDIDAGERTVTCVRPGGGRILVPYDYLIVAAGMQQSYFGHDEFAQWAPGMKTISDALTIRRRVLGAFERAETEADPGEQRRWLTFALVGGGPTGVELAGQIRELATKTLRREYRNIEPEDARVLLFDSGSAPLAAFGERLSSKAARSLHDLGVETHMDSIVTDVDGDGLVARDHDGNETRYDAATVLWAAGVQAPPIAAAVAAATAGQTDRAGRIGVQRDLTIHGHPEISVIGDMMSLDKLPGVAEVAMQSGHYAGRRIKRQLEGKPPAKGFVYHDLGSAAYVSRGRAVLSAGPVHLSGLPGWFGWLFIHIAFLTGYRNRLGAILTWWVAFTSDIRRERVWTTRQVGWVHDIYAADAGNAETIKAQPPQQRRAADSPSTTRPQP